MLQVSVHVSYEDLMSGHIECGVRGLVSLDLREPDFTVGLRGRAEGLGLLSWSPRAPLSLSLRPASTGYPPDAQVQ